MSLGVKGLKLNNRLIEFVWGMGCVNNFVQDYTISITLDSNLKF